MAEPSGKFQQGSTGARAADAPIFMSRTPSAGAQDIPWEISSGREWDNLGDGPRPSEASIGPACSAFEKLQPAELVE